MTNPYQNGALSDTRTFRYALLACVALAVIIGILTVIHVLFFLRGAQMDVTLFYEAAVALRTGADMYAPRLPGSALTYTYPPFLAVLFIPLTYLRAETAAAVWAVCNGLLLFQCLWIGGREFLRRFRARVNVATLPVIMLVTSILFIPRIKAELDQGQTDLLVLLGITLGLVWLRRHPLLAGIALGVVANVKYQTLIFIPYLMLRGWWTTLLGAAAGAAGAALFGALIIGWSTNLDYLRRAFSGMSEMIGIPTGDQALPLIYPMRWVGSVSISSTINRWSDSLGLGDAGTAFGIGLAVLICFVIGVWIYRREGVPLFRNRGGKMDRTSPDLEPLVALEWIGLLVAVLVFAPQTKIRHLILLLPLGLLAVQMLLVPRVGIPRWPVAVGVAVMFLGLVLPPKVTEQMFSWRLAWRQNAGPMFCILTLYFVVLWTGLRSRAARVIPAPGPDPPQTRSSD